MKRVSRAISVAFSVMFLAQFAGANPMPTVGGDDIWFTAVASPMDISASATTAPASYTTSGLDLVTPHGISGNASVDAVKSQAPAVELAGSLSGTLSVPACHPTATPEPAYFLPLGALLIGLGWHRRKSRWSQA